MPSSSFPQFTPQFISCTCPDCASSPSAVGTSPDAHPPARLAKARNRKLPTGRDPDGLNCLPHLNSSCSARAATGGCTMLPASCRRLAAAAGVPCIGRAGPTGPALGFATSVLGLKDVAAAAAAKLSQAVQGWWACCHPPQTQESRGCCAAACGREDQANSGCLLAPASLSAVLTPPPAASPAAAQGAGIAPSRLEACTCQAGFGCCQLLSAAATALHLCVLFHVQHARPACLPLHRDDGGCRQRHPPRGLAGPQLEGSTRHHSKHGLCWR